MRSRRVVLLGFAALLAALLILSWWNPGSFLSIGLRENFVSDFFTSLLSVVVVDQTLEVVERHRERKEKSEFSRAAAQTLDHDAHALWSLLVPARERDDPLRRDDPARRMERFLRELGDARTWADAPAGHGAAVRARIRDLGEDADRLLIVGERAGEGVSAQARLEALREACRAMDEEWETIPRGELASRFATAIAPEIEGFFAALSRDDD